MELASRGHDIHFISYAQPIRLEAGERIHYHEVEVANYPLFAYPPYTLALAARMADVADRYGLDLLHVHYAIPHSVSAHLAREMLAARRRLPFVTTLHGTDITLVGQEPAYFEITRFSIECSDAITTVSDYLNRRTREVFGIDKPIATIPNFVNTALYRPAEEPHAGPPRLIHISNFRPVKRPVDCIRVFDRVLRSTEVELWMVGDGPERSPAERLASQLGIAGNVRFWGKQDNIERLMPQADILLLPSEHEAFGLAALEAMACGVVPVATATGGTAELVTHGVDGFLEGVGDTDSQANRVLELVASASLREQMAAKARSAAVSRYSTDLVIPRYESCYREATTCR
jgi:N-acetyl-alpha-D-glucosaminyl L-malate synthase BshA